MKSILLTIIFTLVAVFTWAGDVTLNQALSVAQTHFATEKRIPLNAVQTTLANKKNYIDASGVSHTAYYVLNINLI